ncbi:hypothetical protein [Lentilactobacillus fungorum]|nr:hypothetical protein [Lentilactobacillus fungorum]
MKFLVLCASALTLCTGAIGVSHYCNQTQHYQQQPRIERGCGMMR